MCHTLKCKVYEDDPLLYCNNCLRSDGHLAATCKRSTRCQKCGDHHNISDCKSNVVCCINCHRINNINKGSYISTRHMASDPKCFARQYKYIEEKQRILRQKFSLGASDPFTQLINIDPSHNHTSTPIRLRTTTPVRILKPRRQIIRQFSTLENTLESSQYSIGLIDPVLAEERIMRIMDRPPGPLHCQITSTPTSARISTDKRAITTSLTDRNPKRPLYDPDKSLITDQWTYGTNLQDTFNDPIDTPTVSNQSHASRKLSERPSHLQLGW